jgi:hypothetical protein
MARRKDKCVECRKLLTKFDHRYGTLVYENGTIIEEEYGEIDPNIIYFLCHDCTKKLRKITIMMPPPTLFLKPEILKED